MIWTIACTAWLTLAQPTPAAIEFNRDIRPILSDACFHCHGPDSTRRKAGLRLDTEEGARAVLGKGDSSASELLRRVLSKDPADQMPPPQSGRRLTPEQTTRLQQWVRQGAPWQKHWAFIPPQRLEPPVVQNSQWTRNPLDRFVLARLEKEGLSPSPEADPITLIRRLSLDLTGLPPSPEETDAFLRDYAQSPSAYDRLVDRLLASPRYGERMAVRWLNAARYADTSGYQSDGERYMWRWRDWVLDAYNANMPFDRFTLEQLAGDLLPNPTLSQRIATGFNRNHRGNAEGGIIPEEYAVEYVVDRVETTFTVWLGLTMGCVRCHDHKYDPLQQKEFYQAFAYFNQVPEHGRAIKYGNSPPYLPAPTVEQQEQHWALEWKLAAAQAEVAQHEPELRKALADWEITIASRLPISWSPSDHQIAHLERLDPGQFKEGAPAATNSPTGLAAQFDGKSYVDLGDIANFGFYDRFSIGAWIKPASRNGVIASRMVDVEKAEGYCFKLVDGKLQVHLTKRWLDDALRIEAVTPIALDRWQHVQMTYDGSRRASGVRLYLDGQPLDSRVLLDELNQTFAAKQPFRIGAGDGPKARFRGSIADLRIHDTCLSLDQVAILATPESIDSIVKKPKRTPTQLAKLRAYFLEMQATTEMRERYQRVDRLREELQNLIESFPTVMVMQDRSPPRDTHLLIRGEYDKPGEKVFPGVPAVLPPLPRESRNDRLAFARWLVHPSHPLTARVAVNRAWQLHFGTGLVKTVDDFGSQGEWPSHPELLDWLATEFVRSGWNGKALHRLIVTSATYRQSSRATPSLWQRDPENRLLARGPRHRLSAEMIRDVALSASGLLVERLGGPSVKPYQPVGLAKELGADAYVQDHGPDLYRRGLYTFWKRTVAPPTMVTFDAPGRETCIVRETRTNTPLQALTLLNEVSYVETARVLAQRVLREAGPSSDSRLIWAFRLVLARPPRPAELEILRRNLDYHRHEFRNNPEEARKLVHTGEFPVEERHDPCELAAYTAVGSLLLNLDEAVTKE